MTDGDFGDDGSGGDGSGGDDGGPLDLSGNGTSLDEFVLFAAITDGRRRSKSKAERPVAEKPASGCALPAVALLLLFAVLAI